MKRHLQLVDDKYLSACEEQLRARLELRRSGAAGIHQDQRKKRNAKALRRDKSYRNWENS